MFVLAKYIKTIRLLKKLLAKFIGPFDSSVLARFLTEPTHRPPYQSG